MDVERLAAEMVAAASSGDAEKAARSAHELKGTAVLFGARELARCCSDVEHASTSDLEAAVGGAVAAAADARAVIEEVLAGGRPPS